jgi:hypothetical protein
MKVYQIDALVKRLEILKHDPSNDKRTFNRVVGEMVEWLDDISPTFNRSAQRRKIVMEIIYNDRRTTS